MNKISNLAISSEQLNNDLVKQKPLLIFDLRNKDDFLESHIDGSAHAVCDAQAKQQIMPKTPKNIKIVLISEPDNLSRETAEMMSSMGLDANYLKGGYSAWNGKISQGQTGKIISADNLAEKLDHIFLLDVRNKDEFSEYKIPGSVNIPLPELFDSKTTAKIPKDKQIVTICPHGNRAMIASFALTRAGIDSQTLLNGLAGWNQVLKPVTVVNQSVKIIQFQKIGKGCLSHVVESDGKAIVIDPLYPFEKYVDVAKKQGFQITKVFDTHQHADHVSSARDLAKAVNAELYLSKYDGFLYDANFIGDSDQIIFGKSKIRVIHTPGHTPGSLSFVVDEKFVFTGDILFVESIGRPDLRDNAEEFTYELYNTLHSKLLKLPNKTMMFSAHHGEEAESKNEAFYSTIELSKNLPWLDISMDEFVKKIIAITRPRPMNYRKIISVNKGELELVHSDIPDLEIGPNRCSISET